MSEHLHETTDATVWAQALAVALARDGHTVDASPGETLHIWMCNAIETGLTHGAAREARTGNYAHGMRAALGPDWNRPERGEA